MIPGSLLDAVGRNLRTGPTGVWWTVGLLAGIVLVIVVGVAGWVSFFVALSLGALWFVTWLLVLAALDLLATWRQAPDSDYIPLPFGFAQLRWLAPFAIPVGFAIGLFVGHLWW